MEYPQGVSFLFPIPEEYQELYKQGSDQLPMEFPNGSTPAVERMLFYHKGTYMNPLLPPLKSR